MTIRPRLFFCCLLTGLSSLACQGPEKPRSSLVLEPADMPGRAWTSAFVREAVLVADEISIEGPHDLIDHVVLRQDEGLTTYTTKTVPGGRWQELAARPEAGAEVRAQRAARARAAGRRRAAPPRPAGAPGAARAGR